MEIPLEDAVLVAIARGVETVGELAEVLNVSREDVERVVERLKAEGLIREEVVGRWIFKKRVLKLTEEGFRRASEAYEKLRRLAEEIRERLSREEGREELEDLVVTWGYVLPLLGWLNLLDLALLDSLALGMWMQDVSDSSDLSTQDIDDGDVM